MRRNLDRLQKEVQEGTTVDSAAVIVSEIMQETEDGGHWSDWYSPRTNIVSVKGERTGERYLIWLINKPENGYPHPHKDVVEWMPYSNRSKAKFTTHKMPAAQIGVDGIGFIRQKTDYRVDIVSTTSSLLYGGDSSSPPHEQKVISGRQSTDINERTGISFDLINGSVLIKGHDSAIELKSGGSVYVQGPINTEEMNSTGPLTENWLGKLLPECLPIFPASLTMLPDPNKLLNIAGKVATIIEGLKTMQKLAEEM